MQTRAEPRRAKDGGTDRAAAGLRLDDALIYVAAILSAATGVLHLLAARDHLDHAPIAAFFVAVAFAQIAWGAEAAWRRRPGLLGVGALLNLGLIGTWVISRTTGVPFIDMVSEREAVGVADATATLFEVLIVSTIGLLALMPDDAKRTVLQPLRAQRMLAGAGAIALLLVVPGFITQGHGHGAAGHGAAGHGHGDDAHVLGTDQVNAAAHEHDAAKPAAAHSDDHAHAATTAAAASPGHAHTGPSHGASTAAAAPHAHGDAPAGKAEHAEGHDDGHDTQASHLAAPPPPEPMGQVASVRYGPFFLPPVDQGGDAHYNRIIPVPAPCVNCRITSMKPDLTFIDGRSANLDSGPMLHHAVLTDPFRNDPTCGRDFGVGGLGHRLFAAGNERTQMVMPAGFGVDNWSPMWVGIFEIMNDAPTSHLVFFDLEITHVPTSDPSTKPVVPVWMDVDNCADSQFSIPKGESHTIWKWNSTLTGRIVGAGGHVHDGGVYMTLTNDATKQRMCTSWAGYGTKPEFMGTIESMSVCLQDRIGVVRAGEPLTIDTYYNTLQAADDVMGIMLVYIYETSDLAGGSAPHPAYTQAPPRSAPPPSGGGHSH